MDDSFLSFLFLLLSAFFWILRYPFLSFLEEK